MKFELLLRKKFMTVFGINTAHVFNKISVAPIFYFNFILSELSRTSLNFFVWKLANFSDSYWFLYDSKLSGYGSFFVK